MRSIIAVIALVTVVTSPLCADGGFFAPEMTGRAGTMGGVSSPGQKGIVIDGGDGTELLILQTTYRGPAEDFAWIVPVPGLPGPAGIFPPSPHFIDMAFYLTQVWTTTDIAVQEQQTGMVFAGSHLEEAPGGAQSGNVTVHRRMTAGDYDAAVLSASDESALLGWLRDEGYAVTDASRDSLAHYIGRDWYFVALKVRPEVAREQPLLTDVQPIAIRFPTDRLTYPLYISRASAPERTTLSLIVLAEQVMECEEIPSVRPHQITRLKGASWASIREDLVGDGEAAICRETVVDMPVPKDAGGVAEDRWVPDPENDRFPIATRMFTILAPNEMVDLTFTAAGAPVTVPHVQRRATVRDIFARSPWAVLLAAALFALVMWRSGHPWRHEVVRLMALLGVVVALWGISVATLAALFVTMPLLLLGTERANDKREEHKGADRWLVVALLLLVILIPVGWLAFALLGNTFGALPAQLAIGTSLLAVLLLFGREALRTGWFSSDRTKSDASERPRRQPLALPLFVAAGWAAILIAAGTSQPAPAIVHADGPLFAAYHALLAVLPALALIFGLELAWVVGTVVFLRRHLRNWPGKQHSAFFIFVVGVGLLYVFSVLIGLSQPGIFGNLWMLPQGIAGVLHIAALALGIALLSFTMLAPFAAPRSRRVAQGFASVAALMGLLVLAGHFQVMQVAEAGSGSPEARAIGGRMAEALEQIDEALAEFTDDTGALPARLEDLTRREAPESGLDGSGNVVAIDGNVEGPWLVALPIDPLTGSTETWVYEVTGDPMVASGGYAIELTYEDPEDRYWHSSSEVRAWIRQRMEAQPGLPDRLTEGYR